MPKIIESQIGKKVNKFTITSEPYNKVYGGKNRKFVDAVCECGNIVSILYSPSGNYYNGCYKCKSPYTDKIKYRKIKTAFEAMHHRCYDYKHQSFKHYSSKGIIVCERWHKFKEFYEDVSPTWKLGLQLDRWPNRSGNYEPSNFRWATTAQQQRNKDNMVFTEQDILYIRSSGMSQPELAEKFNVNQSTISRIINNKRWSK